MYIASSGKSTTGTILPSTYLLWLKAKLAKDTFKSSLAKGKRSSSASASCGKIKIHDFKRADQDWNGLMIFKNFADQDWTRTEKFHSPLISALQPKLRL